MSKTPEQMVEEYCNQFSWNDPREEDAHDAFLAGYTAGFERAVQLQASLAEYIQQQNHLDSVVNGEPLLKKFLEEYK